MRGLDDRCALVTGAARGIGRAIAERLAEEGARVAVSDISATEAQATAATIGGDAIGIELDVTDGASIRRAVDEITQRLGSIAVTRAVLEQMIGRSRGRIVSIASDAGRVGSSGEAVYSGAKAGMMGFSRTIGFITGQALSVSGGLTMQ